MVSILFGGILTYSTLCSMNQKINPEYLHAGQSLAAMTDILATLL